MIGEVDEALLRLLEGAELGGARVVLDRPHAVTTDEPQARVVLHLHAISEHTGLRSSSWEDVHEDDRVVCRRPLPRWYQLAYEVSAVADGAGEEHRLLDAVLRRLILQEVLPQDCITGSLLELGLDVPLEVALPRVHDGDAVTRAPRRPVLDVLITAPMRPDLSVPAQPPARTAQLGIGRSDSASERITATPGDPAMGRPQTPRRAEAATAGPQRRRR